MNKRHRELKHLLEVAARCNEPVAAWKFIQPMRCNLQKGHPGECNHRQSSAQMTNSDLSGRTYP